MNSLDSQSLKIAGDLSHRIALLKRQIGESPQLQHQVAMLEQNLEGARAYLADDCHAMAFIGAVGVGKTTAICHLLGLVDEKGESLLSTSSGRTTLCEVEVRSSERVAIIVDPLSDNEVHAFLFEFIDSIEQRQLGQVAGGRESAGLSSEFERAIRNMLKLTNKRNRRGDGTVESRDEAYELFRELGNAHAFLDEAIKRLDLPNRTVVELICDDDDPRAWIKEHFASINLGRNPRIPMPRRIVIEVPRRLCEESGLNIRIIDTKGLESNVEREDLDNHLKDSRTACFVCSRFNDAPDQGVQALLAHMGDSGFFANLTNETTLVILDRDSESEKVMSEDGPVADAEDGRMTREVQIQDTLRSRLKLPTKSLPRILFHNVGQDEPVHSRRQLVDVLMTMRAERRSQIDEVDQAVRQIEQNRQQVETQAAMKAVGDAIRSWVAVSEAQVAQLQQLYKPVVDEMSSPEVNASTLRASMNRNGKWDNFDVYYKLALAARKKTVNTFREPIEEITKVLQNLERQGGLASVRPFIRQLVRP